MLSTKDLALDYEEDGQNDDHDDQQESQGDNKIKQFDSNSHPIKIITLMLTLDMINFPMSLVYTAHKYRIV